MPTVMLFWKPNGLPMAMAVCPGLNLSESPRRAGTNFGLILSFNSIRIKARSVPGSLPTNLAAALVPSTKVISRRSAESTTWLLVRTCP